MNNYIGFTSNIQCLSNMRSTHSLRATDLEERAEDFLSDCEEERGCFLLKNLNINFSKKRTVRMGTCMRKLFFFLKKKYRYHH